MVSAPSEPKKSISPNAYAIGKRIAGLPNLSGADIECLTKKGNLSGKTSTISSIVRRVNMCT